MVPSVANLWPPLVPLGPSAATVERALGSAPYAEVEGLLNSLTPTNPLASAALDAARFALALRSGRPPADLDPLGLSSQEAFARLGAPREAAFLQVERAAALVSDKALLPRADALLDAVQVSADDLPLAAGLARVRGAVARARADLRGSLLHLERARVLSDISGHPREILRTSNTLGTSYAALGVASLARASLEHSRELAELTGQRQSAAIAAGQLAVLALDADQPRLAIRHLELQRAVCERLGDLHGQARSLSLLVEAHGCAHELAQARAAADACRNLYVRAPSPWTRLQAALATLYEAELALASGDNGRSQELLASCQEERESHAPTFRVVRARGALAILWGFLRDEGPPVPLEDALHHAFARLSRSPRPTWVERALALSLELARRAGRSDLVTPLALRSAALVELRAAAASGALVSLRTLAPDAAVARAMTLGRELVLRARLALGPLVPFEAERIEVTTDGDPTSLDRVLAAFDAPDRPGELADDLLATCDHHTSLSLVARDPLLADRACDTLTSASFVREIHRTREQVQVLAEPGTLLRLGAPC
ncbi:MAG: hypothetical protein RMJ98_17075 [Myxococcales bacterium]|nr:hypothetical protein [Polyangiaceae bacterium]MDW8251009.1 hypothetical protein [Myxococcales bacterium]